MFKILLAVFMRTCLRINIITESMHGKVKISINFILKIYA